MAISDRGRWWAGPLGYNKNAVPGGADREPGGWLYRPVRVGWR